MSEEWTCDGDIDLSIVAELIRPASRETVMIWLTRLAQFKQPFDADKSQASIILGDYSLEFTGMSELAVYAAYKDLRDMPGRYFPTPYEIKTKFNEHDRYVKRIDGIIKSNEI